MSQAYDYQGMSKESAIHYAFTHVGGALIITTIVLGIGFAALGTSDFKMNGYLGLPTALTVVVALIFDFLMLPPLLMLTGSKKTHD